MKISRYGTCKKPTLYLLLSFLCHVLQSVHKRLLSQILSIWTNFLWLLRPVKSAWLSLLFSSSWKKNTCLLPMIDTLGNSCSVGLIVPSASVVNTRLTLRRRKMRKQKGIIFLSFFLSWMLYYKLLLWKNLSYSQESLRRDCYVFMCLLIQYLNLI